MDPVLERLIPGLVGLAITGGAAAYFLREAARARLARSWVQVDGEIIESARVDTRRRRDVLSQAHIVYRYEVDGTAHFGQRVCFGEGLTGNRGVADQRLRDYPVGRAVKVFVNPEKPSEATLLPRATMMVWVWALLAIGVFVIILFAVIFGEG